MKSQWIFSFVAGWVILTLGSCQLDSISPEPTAADLYSGDDTEFIYEKGNQPIYHAFSLNMYAKGENCPVSPAVSRERTFNSNEIPASACLGPLEIGGNGYGYTDLGEAFEAKTDFVFNPLDCACGGQICVIFEESGTEYYFDMVGHGQMDGNFVNSEDIRLPIKLTRVVGPVIDGTFSGYLIITDPMLLAESHKMIRTRAYIRGEIVPDR